MAKQPTISAGLRITASILLLLIVVLMASMFAGCKTIHTETKTTETKTVTVKERDTTIIYQGANITNQSELDSIFRYLTSQTAINNRLNGIQTKVTYRDAADKVALTFWLDKYGKLQADCSSKDSAFNAKLHDSVTHYQKLTEEKQVIKERYVPVRIWILIGCLVPFAAVGIFFFIKTIIKLI